MEHSVSPSSLGVSQSMLLHNQRIPNLETSSGNYITTLSPVISSGNAFNNMSAYQLHEQQCPKTSGLRANDNETHYSPNFSPRSGIENTMHSQHLMNSPRSQTQTTAYPHAHHLIPKNCESYHTTTWDQPCCVGSCNGNSLTTSTINNTMGSYEDYHLQTENNFNSAEPVNTVSFARAHSIPLSLPNQSRGSNVLSRPEQVQLPNELTTVISTKANANNCGSDADMSNISRSTEALVKAKQIESKV